MIKRFFNMLIDLLAEAGKSYTIGREANNIYNETWNVTQPNVKYHGHYFKADIDSYVIKSDLNYS